MFWTFFAKFVISRSSGAPYCNLNGPTIPSGISLDDPFNFTCTESSCTISASKNIAGFVVSGVSSFSSLPAQSKLIGSGKCLTHSQKLSQKVIEVGINLNSDSRTVYATVVYGKNSNGNHLYNYAAYSVPDPDSKIFIIGGGPGGLGAAYYFESIGQNYTLYEQGPEINASFWEDPVLSNTWLRTFYPLGTGGPNLGQGLGGTQNINGAVFAPGTPSDLASSLGVDLSHAQQAQDTVAGHIDTAFVLKDPDWVNVSMMWAPINENDPDNASVTDANQKMKRRSLATNFSPAYGTIIHNTKVRHISDTHLFIGDDKIEYSKVILAAGALSSPQLLNKTEFTVLNHGYKRVFGIQNNEIRFDYENANSKTKQLGNKEEMYANIPGYGIIITMEMEHPFEWQASTAGNGSFTQNKGPEEFDSYQDAYHYIGTVEHTELKVDGHDNVFVGDASALKKPFNCHTSMPAAAAGNLAAKKAMGMSLSSPQEGKLSQAYKTRAYLFLSGLWLLAAGVVAHVYARLTDSDTGNYIHYVFQFTATVLITFAAVLSASQAEPSMATTLHRTMGWTTIGFLWLNVAGGIALNVIDPYPTALGKLHRYSGYTILILLSIMAFSAHVDGLDVDKIANAASFASVTLIIVLFAFPQQTEDELIYSELM